VIDKSRPAAQSRPRHGKAARALATFTPVPGQMNRHDGWTPERQRGFIEALADTGSVRHAAHAVNMTPEGAYLLRRHDKAASFRRAWEAALSLGVQRLEDVAMDRALHGVEQPVYSYGKLIGTRRVTNDALLMFLLRNRAPHRFAADSLNTLDAATQSSLKRLKREWRAEWEAEQAKAANTDAILDRINTRIDRMRDRMIEEMSPTTRRYYQAFLASQRADKAGTSLADLGIDPMADGFDPQVPLLEGPREGN